MSDRVWKKGHVWTRKHLEKEVRLVDVRNFAKRKMAGVEDDIEKGWIPQSEREVTVWMTGFHDALDDLEKWCMGQIDD